MSEKEILLKLVELAYDINKKTNDQVFIDYSPHVNSIGVQIYANGFQEEKESETLYAYLDDRYPHIEKTKYIIDRLEEILENG